MRVSGDPFLRALRFTNYRGLRDVRVPLPSRLTLLVGKNGSGKTSVLEGAKRLAEVFRVEHGDARLELGPAQRLLGRREQLLNERTRNLPIQPTDEPMDAPALTLEAESATGPFAFSLEHDGFVTWDAPAGKLKLPMDGNAGPAITSYFDAHTALAELHPMQFDLRKATESSVAEEETPRVRSDGSGVPSAYAHILGTDRAVANAIDEDVRSIVTGVGKLRVSKKSVTRVVSELVTDEDGVSEARKRRLTRVEDVLEVEMHKAGFLPLNALSEGTVLAVTFFTMLRSPACPKLILVDEVERALHPAALADMIERLRAILEQRGDVQVIATSHSPYLVDAFEAQDVIALALDGNGHTVCRPLSGHPDYDKTRGLQAGEFWSAVGEDWVNGPQAQAAEE